MSGPPGESPTTFRAGSVALFGWTNVGKSTLLNTVVGTKLAAVASVAQTTRHRISGVLHIPDRGQIVFVDTPGLHRPRHRMNRAMVEIAQQVMKGVDVALLVVDASRGLGSGDREAAEQLRKNGVRSVMALNKVDLIRPKTKLLPLIAQAAELLGCPDVVPISARSGEGCSGLVDLLLERLPQSGPIYDEDYLTDQPERVLAAEWIREKLLAATTQELPHATAVIVESWGEREDGLLSIEATILVDRESQKKIVIGTQGDVLKHVGTAARQELEAFLERRIYLGLWVKVRPHWRDDMGTLRELGLG